MTRMTVPLVAAMLLVLSACGGGGDGGEATPTGFATGTFVGLVDDTDAFVAIVSDGAKLAGYVSDGKAISIWFKGNVGDNAATLTARTEQELGDVEFLGDTADGEIEIGGERRSFSAEIAIGDAGLYRAVEEGGGTVEVGWVVLNEGSQRGATSVVEPASETRFAPAPPLDPGQTNVTVDVGGNAVQLTQEKVALASIAAIIQFRPR